MRKTVDISFLPRYNTPILWRKKGNRQIFKTGFQPSALRKKPQIVIILKERVCYEKVFERLDCGRRRWF